MKKWEDKIQAKAQYVWENHKVALLVFILVFPLVIQVIFSVFNIIAEIESWNFKFPDSSNWIGFWGSYLGVIPSGLIAYLVAKIQIDANNRNEITNHSKQIYLNDLQKIYKILNDTLVIIYKLDTIKKYCNSMRKADEMHEPNIIASILYKEFKKTPYKFKVGHCLYCLYTGLPAQSNSSLKELTFELSQRFDKMNEIIQDRAPYFKKEKQSFLIYDDAEFKKILFELNDDILNTHKKLSSEIKNEINNYYNLSA